MNILVCLKQVPKTDELRLKAGEAFSPSKFNLDKKLNIFDAFALEAANRIKDEHPSTKIILLSIGQAGSDRVLVEGLSIGADRAYLVSDDVYSECDTVASAKIICAAINKIEAIDGKFDLILMGRQSTDSSCGVLPEMLSELLGIPILSSAVSMQFDTTCGAASLHLQLRDGAHISSLEQSLPCVISFTKPNYEVRFPTFKSIREANKTNITIFHASDLGYFASSTKLVSVIKPGRNSKNAVINLPDTAEGTALLLDMLKEDKIFER